MSTENIVHVANGIRRDGFEQRESSDIQELFEQRDEDFSETELEEMLNPHSIEEAASTSIENVTFSLKNWSEGLQMANELYGFFKQIDPSMERILVCKINCC